MGDDAGSNQLQQDEPPFQRQLGTAYMIGEHLSAGAVIMSFSRLNSSLPSYIPWQATQVVGQGRLDCPWHQKSAVWRRHSLFNMRLRLRLQYSTVIHSKKDSAS